MEGRPSDGLPMPRRGWAIVALSFGTALLVMDNTIATVALPTVARALDVPSSAAVSVVTIYQMVLLMALLPLSSLGDLVGNRRLYQGGQALFLVATVLCFFVNSLPMLLMTRAAQALGVAAVLSVNVGLLRRIYPARHLGRGLALSSLIIASAGALAPTIGGYILSVGSWRWVFVAAAPFALVSLMLGRALPAPPPSKTRYDLAGALLCAITFGALVAALELAAQRTASALAACLLVVGLGVGWRFVRRELKAAQPILPVDLLARPVFAMGIGAALLSFMGSMSFNLSLPFRLSAAYGLSPGQIGTLMAAAPVAMMCTAPFAGALSDRAPRGLLGGIGMSLSAIGFTLTAFMPAQYPGFAMMAAPLLLSGIGSGLFLAPNGHQIMSAAPPARSAAAGAMISTTRLVGSALGATAMAFLLSMGLGKGPAPALMSATCALIAALCGLVLLVPQRKGAS